MVLSRLLSYDMFIICCHHLHCIYRQRTLYQKKDIISFEIRYTMLIPISCCQCRVAGDMPGLLGNLHKTSQQKTGQISTISQRRMQAQGLRLGCQPALELCVRERRRGMVPALTHWRPWAEWRALGRA